MKTHNSFASNLKSAREKANLTQEQVASQLHILRQAISRWENGKSFPDINTLKALSTLYAISLDELLENQTLKKTGNLENISSSTFYLGLDLIFYVLASVLSLNIPILGIIISTSLFVYLWKTKKANKIVLFIIMLCIIMELYNSFILLNHYFFNIGYSTVQPLWFLSALPVLQVVFSAHLRDFFWGWNIDRSLHSTIKQRL